MKNRIEKIKVGIFSILNFKQDGTTLKDIISELDEQPASLHELKKIANDLVKELHGSDSIKKISAIIIQCITTICDIFGIKLIVVKNWTNKPPYKTS